MFLAMGVGAFARRHLPPLHARVLQGAAVPRIGRGDSRAGRRAGPAAHGRAEEGAADHVLDVPDRRAGDRRRAGLAGLLQQGRDPLPHVRERPHAAVGRRPAHVAADGDLHVPRSCSWRSTGRARPSRPKHGASRRARAGGACARIKRTAVICTTRRRRWRSRSSCSRSARSSPATAAGSGGPVRAFPRAELSASSAGDGVVEGVSEGDADDGVDRRRARRHRHRGVLLPEEPPRRPTSWRPAFRRPPPRCCEQVLRRRDLRRGRSCSRSASCRRTGCGRASTCA